MKTLFVFSLFGFFLQDTKKGSRDSSYFVLTPEKVNDLLRSQFPFPNDELEIGNALAQVKELNLKQSGNVLSQKNCKPVGEQLICYLNKKLFKYRPQEEAEPVEIWDLSELTVSAEFQSLFVDSVSNNVQLVLSYPQQNRTGVFVIIGEEKFYQFFQDQLENIHLFNFS